MRPRNRSQSANGVAYEVGEVDAFRVDLECTGPNTAQFQCVLHEPLESLALVIDRLDELAPFLGLDA